MPRLPRLFLASVLLGALPLLLGLGAALSACDTAGCGGGALQTEDLVVGEGEEATASSTVAVDYVLELEDGTFLQEGDSTEVPLADAIEGFRDGVVGMRVGGRRRLTIPPDLAYGEEGFSVVPPCATLVYEIALLDVR
jgi:FKBP-type peptidyl-prolyl cis-trans isomerase